MAKYHIKNNGEPGICRAKVRPCPLGGAENHFDSMEAAQAHAEQKREELFGLLVEVAKTAEETPVQDLTFNELEERIQNNMADGATLLKGVGITNHYETYQGNRFNKVDLIPEAQTSMMIAEELIREINADNLSDEERQGLYLDGINELSKQAALMKQRAEFDPNYSQYEGQVDSYVEYLETSLGIKAGVDYSIHGGEYSNLDNSNIDEFGIKKDLNFKNKAQERHYLMQRQEHQIRYKMAGANRRLLLEAQNSGNQEQVEQAKELADIYKRIDNEVVKTRRIKDEAEYNRHSEWGKPATGLSFDAYTRESVSNIEEALDEIDMVTSSDLFPAKNRAEFDAYTKEMRGRLRLNKVANAKRA